MVNTIEVNVAKERAGRVAFILMLVTYTFGLFTGYEFGQIMAILNSLR